MQITRTKHQKGFVLITMGVVAVAMLGALGLAIDLGRVFIIRNETQAFCDSAAVAAASFLNNTSAGVQTANAAAKATAIAWNFSTTVVSSPTVEYATTSSGPWSNATAFPAAGANAGNSCGSGGNSDPACGYRFARVKTSVAAQLYFLPLVETAATKTYTMTVNSQAIAGQVDISAGTPSSPYTGISEGCYTVNAPVAGVGSGCPNGTTAVSPPNFGLTIGNDAAACTNANNQYKNATGCYDIQWPKFQAAGKGNGNNACLADKTHADNCFVSNPCANDQNGTSAEIAVVANWAASTNGYWGLQAASSIGAEVIDYQPNPNAPSVSPGSNLGTSGLNVMTSGNQASQASYLDERVNQDPANWETTYTAYLADPLHNGRRLLLSPVVSPVSTTQTVVQGYGLYFLLSDASGVGQTSGYYKGKQVNGNDPYCAVYVGTGCVGCTGNGVGGTTGSSKIALVQ